MQQVEGQDLQGGGGQRQAGGKYDTEPAGKGVPKRGAQDLLGRGKFRMQEVDGLLGDRGGGQVEGLGSRAPAWQAAEEGLGSRAPTWQAAVQGLGSRAPTWQAATVASRSSLPDMQDEPWEEP